MMRNLIKKILKESSDFDWIKDTEPITLGTLFKTKSTGTFNYEIESIHDGVITFRYPIIKNGTPIAYTTTGRIKMSEFLEKIKDDKIIIVNNINESSDLDWIKEIEPWSPLNKNILIDFENDTNWNGWESKKSLELANQVVSKLESFDYDKLDNITRQLGNPYGPEFCYLFLEYREFKFENYNFVSWMGCGSDVYGQEDIDNFQRMTVTEFLQMV